ncbi:MAG: hypothetical protein U9Q98_07830 [Bacteroidota bacterium]|nr:hypothetical protein [Bacteroidota bacterium]
MRYIIISIALLFSLQAFSQKTPEDILDPFFDTFEHNPDKAIEYIFTTNPYIKQNQDGIKRIKERLNTSRKLLGEYYGEELIKLQSVADSFVKYTYMLKYDRQPVKIEIVLYRPNDTWLLYTMQFDDKLSEDFKTLEVEQ